MDYSPSHVRPDGNNLFPGFDLALFTFSRISWPNEQNFAFTNFVVVFVVFNVKSSEKKETID